MPCWISGSWRIQMKVSPILFLVMILLFLMPTGCDRKRTAAPGTQVQVQLKWTHSAQFAGFYVAEKKEFYKAENIAINLKPRLPSFSNNDIVADLVSGKSLFAVIGGEHILEARFHGAPIVAIAVIFQRNPYVYATLMGSPIKRPQEFVGKKIMLPPDGMIQHRALMKKLAIPLDALEYITYDKKTDYLQSGQIDVQMVYRPGSGLVLEERGLDLDFIWLDDYDIRTYADSLVTTEKMIQENPALVKRFLRASLKGWRYAIENQEEAVAATLEYHPELTREQQMRMMQIQTPLIHTGGHPIGWMESGTWQEMQDIFEIEDGGQDINNAFTMDFLKQIYGYPGQ